MANVKSALIAIAAVLAVSTIVIGHQHAVLAFRGIPAPTPGISITKDLSNTGINIQTNTNQKQTCVATSSNSGISGSCITSATHRVDQSGAELRR
jgi:hypothetical protein